MNSKKVDKTNSCHTIVNHFLHSVISGSVIIWWTTLLLQCHEVCTLYALSFQKPQGFRHVCTTAVDRDNFMVFE